MRATDYLHADHLNRPIEMTDTAKNVVWQAHYWPFGEAYSITGAASNNLRFPGQYFLLESGLAYNWYRHYDPTLGRYTQPDPLGFVDGPSVYTYAGSAPGMYVDPTGQCPWCVVFLAGAIFSGGVDLVVQLVHNNGNFACVDPWQVGRAALVGGLLGLAGRAAWLGWEIKVGKNLRIAPFGNRTGNRFGRWPHYHRRVIDPKTGETRPGQGINRHRPWETKQTNPPERFRDRF